MAKKSSRKTPGKTAKKSARKAAVKKAANKKATSISAGDLPSQLEKVLAGRNSIERCVEFFKPLSEPQRRSLAPYCIKWHKQEPEERKGKDFETLMVALVATCNFTELKRFKRWTWPDDEVLLELLTDRNPDWLDSFAEKELASKYYPGRWWMVRQLVRNKLCKKPDSPRYYTGMIGGLMPRHREKEANVADSLIQDPDLLSDEVWRLFEYEGETETSLANVDRWSDAGWAASLVRLSQMGKLPRGRLLDAALGALGLGFNHYRSRWFFDFFDLMKPTEKELKQRSDTLVDLLSSPTPNVAKWAFDKVTALLDSGGLKNLQSLISSATSMLSARQKGTVKDAMNLLDKVAGGSKKLAGEVAMAATVALGHEKADVQKLALKLIENHGHSGDESLRSEVERYVPVAAASFKKQLQSWLGPDTGASKKIPSPGKTKSTGPTNLDRKQLKAQRGEHVKLMRLDELFDQLESNAPEIPSALFDGTEIPRLDPGRKLKPIKNLDELIEVCARVIEDESLTDEGERALDGLSRLCDHRPSDFDQLVGPLVKRIRKLMDKEENRPFFGNGLSADLCGLIFCWTQGQVFKSRVKESEHHKGHFVEVITIGDLEISEFVRKRVKPLDFLSEHCKEIATGLAKQQPSQLLSAPTHEGGWIDSRELVRRINSLQSAPCGRDVVLAILRLAPEGRTEALKKLKTTQKGEWLSAIKYALGAEKIKPQKSAPLWVAAARTRSPFTDDTQVAKAFPKLGPDCGNAARYKVRFWLDTEKYSSDRVQFSIETTEEKPVKRDADLPTQLLQLAIVKYRSEQPGYGYSVGALRWTATVWPQVRESYFAMGIDRMGFNIDWWDASWYHRTFLDPLLDSDTPLLKTGMLLLLIGLAAKEPGEHGLATDAAILAISDGRIGTDNLGAALTDYLQSGFFKLPRWAARLEVVAEVSDLHRYVVLRALERALRGDPKNYPRGLGDLLELMVEINATLETGIADPECRKFLESIKGSSKPAKAAKVLLAAKAGDSGRNTAAVEQAVEGRLQRISEWEKRL